MPRLFTGIEILGPARERMTDLLRLLRPTAPVQWSLDANLHITTKFIGAWPEDNIASVTEALRRGPFPQAFDVKIADIGFFPNANTPRVLMAKIDHSPELACLASDTDRALEALCIPREDRPYTPHITLARIRRGTPIQTLREAIARQPATFGVLRVAEFHLYRSTNGIYTKLATFSVN